ncbi:MAG TPA: hypothetical protein PLZ53_10085 [Candidatus Hydrogenedentes bacterium]|jgi:hypothetical protein|nr:MAG: hypothetical protein BWY07_00028 [Candidatus Hydrogenedentes bacterium ADurb.Bin170]HOD94193.1 hypothetical protein [Candidatus Hydrogenedentota bacterium]HOH43456.1 hypothetical protein [Candidatus Hydrogenedentota bacterium]HOM48049.1 hypothetical protein [Candidatus Hydrogenedentota bacterium]HOR49600.1 hypothetical protein [Candidatus Hydrogenedentota bacterium]
MHLETLLQKYCAIIFYPILSKIFHPINHLLAPIYKPWATIAAMSFFVGTMIWVGVILKESYVNEGRPNKSIWTDLRLWTVVSMLPHVFVYWYFR